jgi:hypothetical protein
MAEDRWLRWQAEAAGTSDGPSIAQVLLVLATAAVLLLALRSSSTGTAAQAPATSPPPCAQHWPPTCHQVRHGR